MDTYIDRIIITNFNSSYEIKEFLIDTLIDMGLADEDACWSKRTLFSSSVSAKGSAKCNNIHTLCTDQMNIALAQRNARPTYFMEIYSKVPLREDGPTRYLLKSAIESIRSRFMHPDLYSNTL